MKRGGPSGWQKMYSHGIKGAKRSPGCNGINLPKESVRPAAPTKWEKLLREYHLDDSSVLLMLRGKGKTSTKLREWIIKHRDGAYVPTTVLEALGIRTRWE